jgi:peptide/nickel transport system permease protein
LIEVDRPPREGPDSCGEAASPSFSQRKKKGMKRFIIKRLLLMGVTLLGLTIVVFIVSRVAPGDPARLAAGPDATEEMVQVISKEFGLDQPLVVQYGKYIQGLLQGNFGRSIRTRHEVWDDIKTFLPATIELVLVSIALATILGILFGVLSAVYRDTWIDHLLRVFTVTGVAVPMFWLGIMLQLLLAAKLHFLPIGGRLDTIVTPPEAITRFFLIDSLVTGNGKVFFNALAHIILPAFVLSFPALASIARINRAEMLEVLHRDFILNERAQGISKGLIIRKYALKNALIPTLTMIGLRYGWMLGGTIVVEMVFDWPGIGNYAVAAAVYSDFQPVMAVTVVLGLNFMIANLLVDLGYGYLDPRVRYE